MDIKWNIFIIYKFYFILYAVLSFYNLHKYSIKKNFYSFIWYANVRSSMNGSSVDFFESLIEEDGRFAELNWHEPTLRNVQGQSQRSQQRTQRARALSIDRPGKTKNRPRKTRHKNIKQDLQKLCLLFERISKYISERK